MFWLICVYLAVFPEPVKSWVGFFKQCHTKERVPTKKKWGDKARWGGWMGLQTL